MGEAKRVREATLTHTVTFYSKPRFCPHCEDELPFRVRDDSRRSWIDLHCLSCSYSFSVDRKDRERYGL